MTTYTELCDRVTQTIVDALEANDTDAWSAPWHRIGSGWAPRNAMTGDYYAGSNLIALACEAMDPNRPASEQPPLSQYTSPWWATYRQWGQLDAQVRKGERSASIVKWVRKARDTEDEPAPPTTPDGTPMNSLHGPRLVPKVYAVFNVAQVDGWEPPAPVPLADHSPIGAAEQWIAASGADISYGHDHAAYLPATDTIEVPALGQYPDPLDHYSTVCHELIHFTSHPSRCNRQLGKRFGDDAYAAEELVAELGAAFTTARLGLTNTPRPDHVAYLSHWLRILKADPRALFAVASQAQKAVDFLGALTRSIPQPDDGTEAAV